MKKLLSFASLSLLTLLAMTAVPAQAAGSVNGNFNVKVDLTSACKVDTSSATALDFGSYTAFGASAPTPTASIKFDCTRGLTISSVAFDTGSGKGVVAGLQYDMTVGTESRAAGTAATATIAGTADVLTYVVTGSMAAGQAGAGAGGVSTDARTLTISY